MAVAFLIYINLYLFLNYISIYFILLSEIHIYKWSRWTTNYLDHYDNSRNHVAYAANLHEMSNIITSPYEMVYLPSFWICILSTEWLSPSNQANIELEIQWHWQHVNFFQSWHLSGKVRKWDIRSPGLAWGNQVKQV